MKKLLFTLTITLISLSGFSQELETILLAREDAEKITNAYLNPGFKGLIYSMNNGWYHTAKVHKKLGFDITIGASLSSIPEKDELFDLRNIGLSSSTAFNQNTTQTVGGSGTQPTATITYQTTIAGQNVSTDFQMPTGIKNDLPLNSVPAPSVQVSVGLPYQFDAMLRYTPEVGNDVKGRIFGFGIKKEITDWFGIVEKTPLHISLLAAYSNMNVDYEIGTVNGDVSTQNAAAEFKLNAYTFQALASLNLPVVNFFGGVGYNTGNVTLNMLGDYTLSYQVNGSPTPFTETVTDPLSLKNDTGSFNATAGIRLSLGFFKLFGSYTAQEYSSFNAGIAFSFR
ncbi:DUF6588 family protein [Tenacibaculum sp. MEBiC06402]|uniref:DUF6588 family protein n=1 Tax=unclassified Tenacibaculum TaxID=2635139 RepID=UPI003B9A6209